VDVEVSLVIPLSVAHALLLIVAVCSLVLVAVLLTEVIAGLPGARHAKVASNQEPAVFAVVMPAHNEVGTIEMTLASLIPEIGDRGQVLVVADNCTDETAAVSAAAGAQVIARHDPAMRGKGYALAFAIRKLASAPPDVVVILDADCVPAPGTISQLVANCNSLQLPLQARYELVQPDRGGGAMARVGLLAWRVKNLLRPSGLSNLGLPCLLMGTGMALPWAALAKCNLETGHLVEDMVLGLELTDAGYPPRFMPDLCVRSALPPSAEGRNSQRARWETGHLQVILQLLPRFLGRGITHAKLPLVALALHAAVPPLAFLTLLLIGTVAASGLIAMAGGSVIALAIASTASVAALLALFLSWHKMGRDLLSIRELLLLPLYVLSKTSIYWRAISGRPMQWIRSKRD
jgi:cellulose synthase/poly-beta-1,6-N-acetylglucosamine synthase-like glycosyltransferase